MKSPHSSELTFPSIPISRSDSEIIIHPTKMDQSFLGLCSRLYNFIMKCLATYAMKSVTLGHSSHQASAQLPSPFEDASLQDKVEPDPAHNHGTVQEMGDGSISSAPSKEERNEEEEAAAAVSGIATQAQPPKKMVSINDTVEEMAAPSRKRSKKKKGTEKMASFDEPKPLKSILKVGSKSDEIQT